MRQKQDDLSARGAEVLVVSFDPLRRVRGYCRRQHLPFRCLADEQRLAYSAYGLGRASWLRTLTPRAPQRPPGRGRAARSDAEQPGARSQEPVAARFGVLYSWLLTRPS